MYISRALLVPVPISQTAAVAQAPAPTASALLEVKNGVVCMRGLSLLLLIPDTKLPVRHQTGQFLWQLTDHSESLEPLQDGSVAGAATQIS